MAERKNLGDIRRGQDDDDGPAPATREVQPDSPYLERLKARLSQQPKPRGGKIEHEPDEPKNPGFVVYGDDGKPIG